jgi:2-keto-3-deoxy-L-rhamnonate aldolase RhmA
MKDLPENPIKKRISEGGVALGLIVRVIKSGEISTIAAASDHDFVFVDTQHAIFNRESVAEIITAVRGLGLAALVRIRRFDDQNAALYLDAGASGLIVPDVNSADEARYVVERCRFAPLGHRSLPGPLVQFNYRPVPSRNAMDQVDAETLIVCMIETREGLKNVDAIAAVDGVDVIHVGAVDLLLSLGKPDKHGCPEILEAIRQIANAANRHGKILGIGGDRDIKRRADYVRQGARFMTTDIDSNLILKAATATVSEMRETLNP